MKVWSLILFVLFSFSVVGAEPPERSDEPDGKPVTAARAAELSLHHTDKLTRLKAEGGGGAKLIPVVFKKQFYRVSQQTIEKEHQPAIYRFLVETYPDKDKQTAQLTILQDVAGETSELRTLAETAATKVNAGPPVNAPEWADRSATFLAQEGLHFLIDRTGKLPAELVPYLEDFVSLKLTDGGKSKEGDVLANVDIRSSKAKKTLRVRVKANGEQFDHELRDPE